MKTFLVKLLFSFLLSSIFTCPGFAQLVQWQGPQNLTDPIYRTGPVGINNTNPREMLEIGGRLRLGDSRVHRLPEQSAGMRQIQTLKDIPEAVGSQLLPNGILPEII